MTIHQFGEDSIEELARQYHQLRHSYEQLENAYHLLSKHRPTMREDMVLYQASSTGTLPAVTSSTTGVTPGKITTAKQLTITSTGGTQSHSTNRNLTIYNMGSGTGAASHVGYAHREFKTGRWVTSVPSSGAASQSKVFYLQGMGVTATSTNSIGTNTWNLSGMVPLASATTCTFASYTTSASTHANADEVVTIHEQQHYLCWLSAEMRQQNASTTGPQLLQHYVLPWVLVNGDTDGIGQFINGRITYTQRGDSDTPADGSNDFLNTGTKHWLWYPDTGTQLCFRLQNIGAGRLNGHIVQNANFSMMPIDIHCK